jgi:hypothetical protein
MVVRVMVVRVMVVRVMVVRVMVVRVWLSLQICRAKACLGSKYKGGEFFNFELPCLLMQVMVKILFYNKIRVKSPIDNLL